MAPGCRLYGVEPEAGDDGQRSLREGRRVAIDIPQTIADGAQTRLLDPLPFEILVRAKLGDAHRHRRRTGRVTAL
jgi:threonine dehydratase